MSLRVVGYRDGRRIVVDEGANRARVAGYGGSLIHHALTLTSKPAPKRQPLNRSQERRDAVEAS